MSKLPKAYIEPHPWRHLIAWVFRRRVWAEDVVPRRWYEGEEDSKSHWRDKYKELRKYLEDIAKEHYPVVRDADKYTGRIGASLLELRCAKCPFGWPCPSWKLATRNDLEPLRIVLRQKKPEDDD